MERVEGKSLKYLLRIIKLFWTKVGERLKRLVIYQILFEEVSVDEAAYWSRDKPWKETSDGCNARGF